jgi:N6-L-threonylcarbamoyladenine synthase
MSATILAIETSCDETAAAVLRGFGQVASHVVLSQADLHAVFGGVVPEVASRNHLASAPAVVDKALSDAGIEPGGLDAIAATTGPGLASALLVGASLAKGLSLGTGATFLAVDHIEGHMLSPFFGEDSIPPHTSLVVSGGHTLLFDVEGFGRVRLAGRTLDDAAGEAFDKAAKMLGLGYPGGAVIDRLASAGDPARYDFPRGMIDSGDLDFSFSGLKTALRVFLEKTPLAEGDLPDVCASFRAAVVDVLVAKAVRAARIHGRNLLAVGGGVAANAALRGSLSAAGRREGIELRFPPSELLTDNALMIAYAAAHHLAAGHSSPCTAEIAPDFSSSALASACQ